MLKGRRTRLCLNNTKLRQYREGFNSGMETKNSPISPSCAYQVSVHGIIYHRLVRNFIKRYFKESLLSIIGFLKHLGDVWPNIGRKWNQLECLKKNQKFFQPLMTLKIYFRIRNKMRALWFKKLTYWRLPLEKKKRLIKLNRKMEMMS